MTEAVLTSAKITSAKITSANPTVPVEPAFPILSLNQLIDHTPAGRISRDDGGNNLGIKDTYTVLDTGQYAGFTPIVLNGKTDNRVNEVVVSTLTQLMYIRSRIGGVGPSSNGLLYWDDSAGNDEDIFAYCDAANAANLSGHNDWRVANSVELNLLIDHNSGPRHIDTIAFPLKFSTSFSSNTIPGNITNANYIDLTNSGIWLAVKTTGLHGHFLVRQGDNSKYISFNQQTNYTPSGRTCMDDSGNNVGTVPTYDVLTTGQYSGTTVISVNGKTDNHSNEVVVHSLSKRVYSRTMSAGVGPSSDGQLYWDDTAGSNEDIYAYCDAANLANLSGHNDWRITNQREQLDLIDHSAASAPYINEIAFPLFGNSRVWSSNTNPSSSNNAMYWLPDSSRSWTGPKISTVYRCLLVRN